MKDIGVTGGGPSNLSSSIPCAGISVCVCVCVCVCAHAKLRQSCPTLYDPIGCSPPSL